jgi:hypothetical protein
MARVDGPFLANILCGKSCFWYFMGCAIVFMSKCLFNQMLSGQLSFWAYVSLGKFLSGQMSFWANGFWTNVFLGKCLSGQISFWANVLLDIGDRGGRTEKPGFTLL